MSKMTSPLDTDDELASIIHHISIDGNDDSRVDLNEKLAPLQVDILTDRPDKTDTQPQAIDSAASPTVAVDDIGHTPLSSKVSSVEDEPQSQYNHEGIIRTLQQRIRAAAHQVASLLNQIYEIQELRHATSDSQRLDTLLSSLSNTSILLRPQITSIQSNVGRIQEPSSIISDELEELLTVWKKAEEQHRTLKEEMKEDGWLVRFRTTADQADAMIDPLHKSYTECNLYLERLSSSHITMQESFSSNFDQPTVEGLEKLARAHASMTKTYFPSIVKILKMIDRSVSGRSFKNGEALRRFGEMTHRWTTLQKQLQQLDARIRIITSQYAESGMGASPGEIEILAETSPYGSPDSRGDYFGYVTTKSPSARPIPSHRSSISSSFSNTSTRSYSGIQSRPSPGTAQASSSTLSPESAMRPPSLRKRASIISNVSTTTERNRVNSFSKSPSENMQTPTHKRNSTVPTPYVPRSVSPTPSAASMTSTMSRRQSRIPIASPSRFSPGSATSRNDFTIPGLAVSTSSTRTMLAEPIVNHKSQDHLARARMGLKTPEPSRPRMSSTFSAYQPRPSPSTSGTGTPMSSRSYSSNTAPRTAPARSSLARAPPSSFRIGSPTPSGIGGGGRPSSRLSMMSYSNFNAASLIPFEPSKYDLLDTEVYRIIEEANFDLFIARVDQAMKKGQRRRDDEEWKGEYVFGAGEKPTSVKLLVIAGAKTGQEKRVKCLVRTGGAWHDLGTVLRHRLAAVRGQE